MKNKTSKKSSNVKSQSGIKEAHALRVCTKCQALNHTPKCLACGAPTKAKEEPKKIGVLNPIPSNLKKSRDGKYRFPRELSAQELENKSTILKIEETAAGFNCLGKIIKVSTGPVVTQFDFVVNRYTRAKKLRDLNEDLALVLSVDNVTVTRIPGQPTMAIMVPNKVRHVPTFEETLQNVIKVRNEMEIPLNLGVDSLGNPVVLDLVRLPHILIAGSTGSGKSVCVNNILTSLLYIRSPKQLELNLIDPKSVELFPYQGLPHVRREPANTVHGALDLLESLDTEMRRRMGYLHLEKCKNLKELNDKRKARGDEPIAYVLIVIDELADLIMQEKKAVTTALAAISSVARAAGIHIIAVTQRPSVDVLSGKVKVNFPCRMAFKVPSFGDSKTILTQKGAEQLMKCGDAYIMGAPDRAGLVRVHVPLVEKKDIDKMLELSLAIGHIHRTPADATKEELAEMVKQLDSDKKDAEKAEGTSIADALENGQASKKGYVQ